MRHQRSCACPHCGGPCEAVEVARWAQPGRAKSEPYLTSRRTAQEAKKLLEEKFKTGKNRWFFTKLRF